jgi:hypothetical protein
MNGVRGTVNYLAAGSTRNRLYVAPGDQRATARYEPHQVFVGGGRGCGDDAADGAHPRESVELRTVAYFR